MSRATGIGNRHANEAVSPYHDRVVRTSACMQEVYDTAQRIARLPYRWFCRGEKHYPSPDVVGELFSMVQNS
jgi:hypothetical protein